MFQKQRHITPDGIVDAQTAAALNEALRSLGAFGDGNTARPQRTVAGQVVQGDGTPFGSRVILFEENAAGSLRLGEDSTDPEGRYAITYALPDGTDGASCAWLPLTAMASAAPRPRSRHRGRSRWPTWWCRATGERSA